jgi:hypothetical protein
MSWPFISVASLQTACELFPESPLRLLQAARRSSITVASLQTAQQQLSTKGTSALVAGSSPRKPGSLLELARDKYVAALQTA